MNKNNFRFGQLALVENRTKFFVKNIIKENSRVICSICQEILIDPCQTRCGCRFCSNCIKTHFNSCENICPDCKMEIPKDFITDRAVEREIFNFEVRCLNEGCDKVCKLKYLDDHLSMCMLRNENCDKCQQLYPIIMKEKHLQEICMNGILKCSNCGLEMTRNEYQTNHVNLNFECIDKLCENLSGKCPYECSNEIYNVKNHLNECPNKLNKCLFSEFGCQFLGKQEDISKHVLADNASHIVIMMKEIKNLKTNYATLDQAFIEIKDDHETQIKKRDNENFQLKNQIGNLLNEIKKSQNEIQNIKAEINLYKEQIGEIKTNDDVCIVNGVCTWTIKNFRQKISDAKLGIETQITSKPFYLHKPGYQFSLKVYPNGDGQGKNSFLSIYFIILKGEYDEEIIWPFSEKVSLSLISSNQSVSNITVLMKPDCNMICYGKPVNEFNLGAGQPEFVNLLKLIDSNDFIHLGSIRIQFEVKNEIDSVRHESVALQSIRKIK